MRSAARSVICNRTFVSIVFCVSLDRALLREMTSTVPGKDSSFSTAGRSVTVAESTERIRHGVASSSTDPTSEQKDDEPGPTSA